MTLAALAQDTVEKRAVSRHRVLLGAKLVWGQNAFTPECVIRNLTPRGAAIRMEPGLALPGHVALIELAIGRAHEARVAWHRNGFVGLEIVSTRDLRSAGSNDPLRQLWIDRLPRVR